MEYESLLNRAILDILIGDKSVAAFSEDSIYMPYLKGWQIAEIGRAFGYKISDGLGSGAPSRWVIMKSLIEKFISDNCLSDFFTYIFDKTRFSEIVDDIETADDFDKVYRAHISLIIDAINKLLVLSDQKLIYNGVSYSVVKTQKQLTIDAPSIHKIIDVHYVDSLYERINRDIQNGDYDSVVTKSRTLIEEVLIFIIEQNGEQPDTSGKISKLSGQCKSLLNMKQQKYFDERVNEILSGLEKIVNGISLLRNAYSDSHGVGKNRVNIKRREAVLISNASKAYCEYILSVYNDQNIKA